MTASAALIIKQVSVQYGGGTIVFTLCYRPVKYLRIEVYRDGRVEVIAPAGLPLTLIQDKVLNRARWIIKQRREFAQMPEPQPPLRFRSGETLRYLGRQYRLKLQTGPACEAKLLHGRLVVSLPDPGDTRHIRSLVQDWYRTRGEIVIAERIARCQQLATRHHIPAAKSWTLKRLKSRWGSCSKAGHIVLNIELIQVGKDSIDYVILHELCHLLEHNHGPAFYRLLERVLPEWRERKRRLNAQFDGRSCI